MATAALRLEASLCPLSPVVPEEVGPQSGGDWEMRSLQGKTDPQVLMARTEPGAGLLGGQGVTQNTGPTLWPPSVLRGLTTDVPLCRTHWSSHTLLATPFSSIPSTGHLEVVEKALLLEIVLGTVVCLGFPGFQPHVKA